MYHEKQSLFRCGIHALNNLLQAPVFSKETFDQACMTLHQLSGGNHTILASFWNAHEAPLGLGNYDVNVLMYVLQEKGFSMEWFDKRQEVQTKQLNVDELEGILCNIVSNKLPFNLWTQRHWFAIKKIDGIIYNLDSKLPNPMPFANDLELCDFLKELLNTGECEMFLIKQSTQPN